MTKDKPGADRRSGKQRPKARVGIYARFSSHMQSKESANDQIKSAERRLKAGTLPIRLYAEHDCEIVLREKDEAETGRVAGRDGYLRCLNAITNDEIDVLVVDDLSRMTRDLGDTLDLYELSQWHGKEIVSACDGVSSAEDNAKQFFVIRGMVNEFANQGHSNRTSSRMEQRFVEGFSVGQLPYGYTSEATETEIRKGREVPCRFKIMVHPKRAEIVVRILQLYAEGHGRQSIARILNADHLVAPGSSHLREGRVGGWNTNNLKRILGNERYIGVWRWKKTTRGRNPHTGKLAVKRNDPRKVVEARFENLRLVPQDLWDKVAKRKEQNRETRRRARKKGEIIFGDRLGKSTPDYILSGLCRCCECGSNLVLTSGKSGGYYGCHGAYVSNNGCLNKASIRRRKLERGVIFATASMFTSEAFLRMFADRINHWLRATRKDLPRSQEIIQKELNQTDKEIANLVSFIASGNGSGAVGQAIKQKEQRRQLLEAELRKLALVESQTVRVLPKTLSPFVERFIQDMSSKPQRANRHFRALFPGGIKLTPPDDPRNRGTWFGETEADGRGLLFSTPYGLDIRGFPENPTEAEPTEGRWFGELVHGAPGLITFEPPSWRWRHDL